MAVDVAFQALLDKRVDDAKPPPVLPAGTYFGVINKYEFGKSSQKQTPFVRYFFQLTGHSDDVSDEQLVDQDNKPIDLTKRQGRAEFYLTPDADWRLAEFLKSIGVQTAGKSFLETIPEAQGASILADVGTDQSKDNPPRMFNKWNSIRGQTE